MANKTLFKSRSGGHSPRPDVLNAEGAPAYAFEARHALAQYAVTGCLQSAFYAGAEVQLDRILELCSRVDERFIAQCAVYARTKGHMKDVPALLVAVLAAKQSAFLGIAFERVIDNPRMLRNFVQIIRSGVVGRRSLGTAPRRLIRKWLASRSDDALLRASVGKDPSLADVVKLVHPRPATSSRRAFYGWLLGRKYDAALLPKLVTQFEAFRTGRSRLVPDVPFRMLTSLPLTKEHWQRIAGTAGWQATRMNLNTFARHGVFDGGKGKYARIVAERLTDRELVRKARVLPYQLLAAYRHAGEGVPDVVRKALGKALDLATANVPKLSGRVVVCPDVSGSMQSPVTGYSQGRTSKVQCVDVAALIAATVLRQRPKNIILPFNHEVLTNLDIDPRASVLENADRLARASGGTALSAPLRELNRRRERASLVIIVSDNESWFDAKRGWGAGEATQAVAEWEKFRSRNPDARLVCLDIQPYEDTQVPDREGVLNIGGFSDSVFDIIAKFAAGQLGAERWVRVIENVNLD